ncbi:glutamine-hydrolyzing carbamoyl-phosphate synthase small subunit [archaeon]|jgi:carbamoyl-phosphate synthase small subunit|nr:glutamine-hydrolyzing carbamoyl-phosphate synthase small subunit [archaeon]MBT4351873.1 glutamine-hydrolyzing carbamoyl-phosphate synthase small subunit [archaeon]MBT4647689.1 glutamine-hydrolyzing carbamoyl-phosphate synthase small subunit [archaeon]MBT6822361.1 glutamine-hydrolyzing carbamoyl-phosphate synthase small subunit [archaeon]MBT7391326.1 glutamine-hydrolyzing carbamoyl-phosphate synthase small subunit [archaeon]
MSAKLILEDGTVFEGESFGSKVNVTGEVVFNTGMVGYPESFTDPSYKGQILTLTYPMIGNYGVPEKIILDDLATKFESDKIHITGLIVSQYVSKYSHWDAKKSLSEWLIENNIPAISGIDTRKLTKKLREKGVMLGKIVFDGEEDIDIVDPNKDILAELVSCKEPITYGDGEKKVVLIDCGAKYNIIRSLVGRGVTVIRVPWNYDFNHLEFDGLMISNGPGDPKMCVSTVANIKKSLKKEKPTFGICFGNQLLALAAGGDTYKMKYGHRSQNQPCIDTETKRCYITSQNHGYAVDTKSLSKDWKEWFVNANDGTNEGIKHKTKPFFTIQFHPENWPGPKDTEYLFDKFVNML